MIDLLFLVFLLFLLAIWVISSIALANRCEQKQVPGNCLIWFLIICPIINTILAIYFCYKQNNYKESLKILFSND